MSNISPTITFTQGVTTITLPSPVPGSSRARSREQNISESAAGHVYVYDKGVSWTDLSMSLEITAAQKASLDSFFNSNTQGGVNLFSYVDNKSVTHSNCRFMQTELRFDKQPSGLYRVELNIRTTSLAD